MPTLVMRHAIRGTRFRNVSTDDRFDCVCMDSDNVMSAYAEATRRFDFEDDFLEEFFVYEVMNRDEYEEWIDSFEVEIVEGDDEQ